MWASILIHCAKLMFEVAESTESIQEAFSWLLQIKQCLPVIDSQLADVKLPTTVLKYVTQELIDFQAVPTQTIVAELSQGEFRPQEDYDERFFMQTKFTQ